MKEFICNFARSSLYVSYNELMEGVKYSNTLFQLTKPKNLLGVGFVYMPAKFLVKSYS